MASGRVGRLRRKRPFAPGWKAAFAASPLFPFAPRRFALPFSACPGAPRFFPFFPTFPAFSAFPAFLFPLLFFRPPASESAPRGLWPRRLAGAGRLKGGKHGRQENGRHGNGRREGRTGLNKKAEQGSGTWPRGRAPGASGKAGRPRPARHRVPVWCKGPPGRAEHSGGQGGPGSGGRFDHRKREAARLPVPGGEVWNRDGVSMPTGRGRKRVLRDAVREGVVPDGRSRQEWPSRPHGRFRWPLPQPASGLSGPENVPRTPLLKARSVPIPFLVPSRPGGPFFPPFSHPCPRPFPPLRRTGRRIFVSCGTFLYYFAPPCSGREGGKGREKRGVPRPLLLLMEPRPRGRQVRNIFICSRVVDGAAPAWAAESSRNWKGIAACRVASLRFPSCGEGRRPQLAGRHGHVSPTRGCPPTARCRGGPFAAWRPRPGP